MKKPTDNPTSAETMMVMNVFMASSGLTLLFTQSHFWILGPVHGPTVGRWLARVNLHGKWLQKWSVPRRGVFALVISGT
jgi:hypothetical protein